MFAKFYLNLAFVFGVLSFATLLSENSQLHAEDGPTSEEADEAWGLLTELTFPRDDMLQEPFAVTHYGQLERIGFRDYEPLLVQPLVEGRVYRPGKDKFELTFSYEIAQRGRLTTDFGRDYVGVESGAALYLRDGKYFGKRVDDHLLFGKWTEKPEGEKVVSWRRQNLLRMTQHDPFDMYVGGSMTLASPTPCTGFIERTIIRHCELKSFTTAGSKKIAVLTMPCPLGELETTITFDTDFRSMPTRVVNKFEKAPNKVSEARYRWRDFGKYYLPDLIQFEATDLSRDDYTRKTGYVVDWNFDVDDIDKIAESEKPIFDTLDLFEIPHSVRVGTFRTPGDHYLPEALKNSDF